MKNKITFISLFFIIFTQSIFSFVFANYNFLEDKRKQILYFKLDLEELDKKISINNEQISILSSELKNYDEEFIKITELLKDIENNKLDTNINNYINESEIIEYTGKLEKLKNSYRQKIIWMYKHGSDYGLEILFSSNTFNDFYVRLEYLQRISQIRKKDFEKIRYYEKRIMTEDKIQILKNGNDIYSREKTLKYNAIEKIQNEISLQKNELTFDIKRTIDYNSDNFDNLQNKLIYPVNSNYIIVDFDKSIDPASGAITYDNGVDFSISRNSDVSCVADGIIEDITFIPSYGNVVLIKHSNDYRTLYAILKDIYVKVNQVVNAGDVIAKTSDNYNGQCFHFELWHDTTPLDPKQWMKKGALVSAK